VNQTIQRFGYPATLVADYLHWVVLLRPSQPTLGSLVLAEKSDAMAFAEIPAASFTELRGVVSDIETVLRARVNYQKINYMMLMMVDPNVHFHVIPRYEGERTAEGISVPDKGWPRPPALGEAVELSAAQIAKLAGWLKQGWPKGR